MTLRRIVSRLHASASNTDVVRAVRKTIPRADMGPGARAHRKALYRYALALHRSNVVVYITSQGGVTCQSK